MTLHSGKSQVFFSARELAEMARARGVSGFPHTERRAREYAIREGWTELPEHLCRKRPGRGGGLEFHFSLLPDVLRDTMDGLAVKAHAAQRHEDRALADQAKLDAIRSHSLPPRARATMEARAEILTSIDGYAIANSQKRSWAIGRFLIAQTEYEDRQEIEGRRDCGEFLTPREVESLSYPLTLTAADGFMLVPDRLVKANDRKNRAAIKRSSIYSWLPWRRRLQKPRLQFIRGLPSS